MCDFLLRVPDEGSAFHDQALGRGPGKGAPCCGGIGGRIGREPSLPGVRRGGDFQEAARLVLFAPEFYFNQVV